MTNRQRMSSLALSYDGIGVTHSRERYLDLVGPHETPQMRAVMSAPSTSGCALVVRGLLRSLGVDHPSLSAPYRLGMAVADVIAIGRYFNAWSTDNLEMCGEGDVVIVNHEGKPNEAHVYTVIATVGASVRSIDGGQRDRAGNQCIASRWRTWLQRDGVWWDDEPGNIAVDPAQWPAQRVVMGWIAIESIVMGDEAPRDTDPAPPLEVLGG